jgi:tetratricopeptide (TPR) repeat protein
VELGRVHKDLSRHDLSLETMERAKSLLDSIFTTDDNARLIHELQTRIDHFRGIAYSQIGRTLECVGAYFESIKRSRQANSFGAVDALSLGYLAYELKFYHIDQSLRFAHQAVEFSRRIRSRNILVKNLCSLGQIQSFARNLEKSKASFTEAQQLCYEEPPDLRELGRILVNSAVTYISDRLWDQASHRLIDADKLFGESGDRRRKFMAKAYQGIMFYHIGQQNDALALLREAFEAHLAIGAKRETLYEALTLVWMHNNGNMPKTDQMSSWDGSPSDIVAYLRNNVNADLDIFVRFWRHSYVPTLLTLRGSDVSPVNV